MATSSATNTVFTDIENELKNLSEDEMSFYNKLERNTKLQANKYQTNSHNF